MLLANEEKKTTTTLPSERTKQTDENGNKQTTCFVRIDIDHQRVGCDCFHYVNVVQVERVRVVQHFGQLGHQFELCVQNLQFDNTHFQFEIEFKKEMNSRVTFVRYIGKM